MKLREALSMVKREVLTAQKQFSKFHSTHEGIAVIEEEYDELWREIKWSKHGSNAPRIRTEAKHLAAMAIRFLLDCT